MRLGIARFSRHPWQYSFELAHPRTSSISLGSSTELAQALHTPVADHKRLAPNFGVPLRELRCSLCICHQRSSPMIKRDCDASACVYGLADSLDGILASCEDLQKTAMSPSELRALELAVIKYVLQARRYIREFDPWQPQLVTSCAHFLMATAALTSDSLEGGKPEREGIAAKRVSPEDHDLIGGQVPLNVVRHLAGTLLDVLEAQFALFEEDVVVEESARARERGPQPEPHSWIDRVTSFFPTLSLLKGH